MFEHKTILVTGGTGSFGNVVAKHLLQLDKIKEVRVFSRDEKKQEDMRHHYQNKKLKFFIGDVRDSRAIENAMRGVDYVFSAAALKQVPSCEFHPMEAVYTNIVGTENVLNAAIACQVQKVIVLSTDKAVYPVNAMGISKAMMEKVAVAKSRVVDSKNTLICATRYGNVLGSRGSVVPLFIKQIKEGKPLTLTDPHMTRFIMSLDEAMKLVFFAFENAKGGDIFVQKAPACTIGNLAKAVCELFGKNTPIVEIGTRHGEKKHETLMNREERIRSKDLGRFYQIPDDDRDLNYSHYFTQGESQLAEALDYSSDSAEMLSVPEIKSLLLEQPFVAQELGA